ncbi:hypothetical protein ACCT08_35490, partial [Rhizobium johnstonii]
SEISSFRLTQNAQLSPSIYIASGPYRIGRPLQAWPSDLSASVQNNLCRINLTSPTTLLARFLTANDLLEHRTAFYCQHLQQVQLDSIDMCLRIGASTPRSLQEPHDNVRHCRQLCRLRDTPHNSLARYFIPLSVCGSTNFRFAQPIS